MNLQTFHRRAFTSGLAALLRGFCILWKRTQCDIHVARLAVPKDPEMNDGTRSHLRNPYAQIVGAIYGLTVELKDHVTPFEPGLGRWSALRDIADPATSDKLAIRHSSHPTRTKKRIQAALPKAKKYKIGLAEGTITDQGSAVRTQEVGTLALSIPFFLSRHITAAELKAFAGRPTDTLLRFGAVRWEIVDDADLIDLQDETTQYRLGPIQIYS